MLSLLAVVLLTIWPWLPAATVVLRFVTALIGCVLAFSLLVRRIRIWLRRRRR